MSKKDVMGKFLERSKELVKNDLFVRYGSNELRGVDISLDDIYVVWSAKTLQNCKALLSTDIVDGLYYESTYNGDNKEIYFDTYKKLKNIPVPFDINE